MKKKQVPIIYTLSHDGIQRRITGKNLLTELLRREEGGIQGRYFNILNEGLPDYVWDNLFISADGPICDKSVKYKDISLRKFLEYYPNRFISEEHEKQYHNYEYKVINTPFSAN